VILDDKFIGNLCWQDNRKGAADVAAAYQWSADINGGFARPKVNVERLP
jgi:hypothetical protein